MSTQDPLDLTAAVEEQYRRYLETTFAFRDPALRGSFSRALASGRLRKGPYIEAARSFTATATLSDVLEGLKFDLDPRTADAFQAARLLFRHQERAVGKVMQGQNVVVATGTGSGKTEAFLYPILLHLYDEFRQGSLGPGVRALILYPMNALANDQRDRLGAIFKRLVASGSDFRFTFGQYIGDTPEDAHDTYRHARVVRTDSLRDGCREEGASPTGELVFRSEMRAEPPNILLTNYSMLEYLLLRPSDSPLFDDGRAQSWRFLVLDEAHQYRGSRGIEMAMLLRRLKRRIRDGGRIDRLSCIATSATLAGEGEGADRAARFASSLFGEPFGDDDIIFAESDPLPEPRAIPLGAPAIARLAETWTDAETLRDAAREVGVALDGHASPARGLGDILHLDARVVGIRRALSEGPTEFGSLADETFHDVEDVSERRELLAKLVSLVALAEDSESHGPMVSLRYHVFLRALEGAFVSYVPSHEVFLERRSPGDSGGVVFEAALCRECGQHYFVGGKDQRSGRLEEPVRDSSHPDFGASFFRPVDPDDIGEDEDGEESSQDLLLCTTCGELGSRITCEHSTHVTVRRERAASAERPDELAVCGACGYTASGRDPVREIIHGTDGPNAVIATTLFTRLPEDRRKILAFADGRQEAAFFAWYLQSSYEDIVAKSAVLRVIRELEPHTDGGVSISELASHLAVQMREEKVVPASQGDLEVRQRAYTDVYKEFSLVQPRLSLEGVGLVRWALAWPVGLEAPQLLLDDPWRLSTDEACVLVEQLLSAVRLDRAIDLRAPSGVALLWSDVFRQRQQTRFVSGLPGRNRFLRSWDGLRGRRAGMLRKLLVDSGLGPDEQGNAIQEALRAILQQLAEFGLSLGDEAKGLFVPHGDGRVLNPEWWRATSPATDPQRCETCGRFQWVAVRGLCSSSRCDGRVVPTALGDVERHHYRFLYQSTLPPRMSVEEHTAQLGQDVARTYQRRFRDGDIDVLSSSTTFELGVDLGDLDVVFLRNVPPESFNYVQRVGRAGRRRGHPGFAITYCRRSSHDLYHFTDPSRYLRGVTSAPLLRITNEKIVGRHIVATVLSAFFRHDPERFASVDSLLGEFGKPRLSGDVVAFARTESMALLEQLVSIVPEEMHGALGLQSDTWWRLLGEEKGGATALQLAEAEVVSDYRAVAGLEEQAIAQRDYRTAEWARRRADTISGENALSFLSRKAVIPKYGFPVDLVELDTRLAVTGAGAGSVELQRDLSLAISEFAPESKLIANKSVWTSHALKRVVGKEWPRSAYHRCSKHNTFQRWEIGATPLASLCGCSLPEHEYVIPQFGFTTSRKGPAEPTVRTGRLFTSRPFFAGPSGAEGEVIEIPNHDPVVAMRKASPGWMVVICEGRKGAGFYVCGACGTGMTKRSKDHETAYGAKCNGSLREVSLAHEFVTDVLQIDLQVPPGIGEPLWAAYSTAFGLVEGVAEVLEVPSTDLAATIRPTDVHTFPRIVLYDNVPGGAGLVADLEEIATLVQCVEVARERVGGRCGCAEESACYACLRSYRNQFAHPYLQRGYASRALDWLAAALSR